MRTPTFLLLVALTGCSTSKSEKPPKPKIAGKQPPAKTTPPIIDPAFPVLGRISLVNEKLRYVVIDFSVGRRPQAETRLNVFRQGQKVGELKVSIQAQEGFVAADITAGDVRMGDEVKEN